MNSSSTWSRGVAVITSALHAAGRQFDPGRLHSVKHLFLDVVVKLLRPVNQSVCIVSPPRHASLRRNNKQVKQLCPVNQSVCIV